MSSSAIRLSACVFASAERFFHRALLPFRGRPAQRDQVSFVHDLFVLEAHELLEAIAFSRELLVEGVAVGEVERLGHARFIGPLAIAGLDAVGPPEAREKIRGRIRVRKLQRPVPHGIEIAKPLVRIAMIHPKRRGHPRLLARPHRA